MNKVNEKYEHGILLSKHPEDFYFDESIRQTSGICTQNDYSPGLPIDYYSAVKLIRKK